MQSRYLPKRDSGLFVRTHKQVEQELRPIQQLGLAGYSLIVWNVIEFCKRNAEYDK
jgi:error-prone DNA polymerase